MSSHEGDVCKPQRRRKRQRPKRIQGAALEHVLSYLDDWNRGIHRGKLTWERIAEAVGFSRQALSSHDEIVDLYNIIKASQRTSKDRKAPKTTDERIEALKAQVASLQRTINNYDERWQLIAYHAGARGIDLWELQQPLPPLDRKVPKVVRLPRKNSAVRY